MHEHIAGLVTRASFGRDLLRRWVLPVLAAMAMLAISPRQAHAGNCRVILGIEVCGDVANESPLWILIAGCWPDGSSNPRYVSSMPGCENKILPGDGARSDSVGASYYIKDTDTFRVDVGCVTKFIDEAPASTLYQPGEEVTEDRRGMARNKWLKLGDPDAIHVTSQWCPGGSPPHYFAQTWAVADGYQDQFCYGRGGSGDADRCNSDGHVLVGRNYFICRVWGARVGTTFSYNHWWLLTDLDPPTNSGRDGRSYVSAYYLTGGKNSQNDSAYDENGNWIPEC